MRRSWFCCCVTRSFLRLATSLVNWWFKVTVLSYVCVFVGACSGTGFVGCTGGGGGGAGVVFGAVSAVPIGPPVLGATARTRAEAGGSAPVGACVFGPMSLSR